MQKNRRNVLKSAVAAMAGAGAAQAQNQSGPTKKVHYTGPKPTKTPMFSSAVSYGNLLFIAGIGAHVAPFEIKAHTDIVLKEIERLLKNGSSMEKVLKVTVFLNDLKDRDAMGEVFQGRFGSEPRVRTTIAPPAEYQAIL